MSQIRSRHTITVDRPHAEVFDLLADLSAHEQFTDHFIRDWRIEGDPRAVGAVLHCTIKGAGPATITVVSVTSERIEENGRGGPGMKRRTRGVYDIKALAEDRTEITFTADVLEPHSFVDKLTAPIARSMLNRMNGRAMERLQALLETQPAASLHA